MRTESPEKLDKENKTVRAYMIDMIIMLVVVAVVAVYTYGTRAVEIILLSVLSSVIVEVLGYLLFLHEYPKRLLDLSAIFTGLAIALAVPSSSPLWLAPLASAFAIAVAKLPFGNANTTPFVPAAVGIAFASVSFPDLMFTYPSLSIGSLSAPIYGDGFISGISLAQMLNQSKSIGTNVLNIMDVFVGRIPGPMGASCLILMLGTLVYMLIRKHSGFISTISFIAACSVMAVLFPRVLTGRSYSLLMELSAGLLFYAAVFFISDPVTSPKNQLGKVLYGACAGVLAMIFRYLGSVEDATCFVILIMNSLFAMFDKWGEKLGARIQQKNTIKPTVNNKKNAHTAPANDDESSNEGGILDHE